ncbi:YetF domain-containing protein [Paenarthrobacter sp. PH39-S1]|uniref:YetF domain-containing protein n=1 Tax=Paenarthrobacter sp. PH39-S1 TaxID=3046204 RepID=UPI0024B9A1AF|nr:YetF domain-containing protein [Paenarthrobacter sp. PH39-S1]MDJ0356881.1 DUF421 domain-containing protein [Paenarthrobacter sp. PH39-S1]
MAWTTARHPKVRTLLTAEPALLLRHGCILPDDLRKNRLTVSEVHQTIRSRGSGHVADIAAVVMETNGTISVITKSKIGSGSALVGVRDAPSPR